jgi:hypothetical protein
MIMGGVRNLIVTCASGGSLAFASGSKRDLLGRSDEVCFTLGSAFPACRPVGLAAELSGRRRQNQGSTEENSYLSPYGFYQRSEGERLV